MAATGSGGARRVFPPAPSTLHRTVGGVSFLGAKSCLFILMKRVLRILDGMNLILYSRYDMTFNSDMNI